MSIAEKICRKFQIDPFIDCEDCRTLFVVSKCSSMNLFFTRIFQQLNASNGIYETNRALSFLFTLIVVRRRSSTRSLFEQVFPYLFNMKSNEFLLEPNVQMISSMITILFTLEFNSTNQILPLKSWKTNSFDSSNRNKVVVFPQEFSLVELLQKFFDFASSEIFAVELVRPVNYFVRWLQTNIAAFSRTVPQLKVFLKPKLVKSNRKFFIFLSSNNFLVCSARPDRAFLSQRLHCRTFSQHSRLQPGNRARIRGYGHHERLLTTENKTVEVEQPATPAELLSELRWKLNEINQRQRLNEKYSLHLRWSLVKTKNRTVLFDQPTFLTRYFVFMNKNPKTRSLVIGERAVLGPKPMCTLSKEDNLDQNVEAASWRVAPIIVVWKERGSRHFVRVDWKKAEPIFSEVNDSIKKTLCRIDFPVERRIRLDKEKTRFFRANFQISMEIEDERESRSDKQVRTNFFFVSNCENRIFSNFAPRKKRRSGENIFRSEPSDEKKTNKTSNFWKRKVKRRKKNRFATKISLSLSTNERFSSLSNRFFSSLRTGFVLDPQHFIYHYWLLIISLAVIYNCLFIPFRYSFSRIDEKLRWLWLSLDYSSDLIYLIDIFVQSRTGSSKRRETRTYRKIVSVCSIVRRILQSWTLRPKSRRSLSELLFITVILSSRCVVDRAERLSFLFASFPICFDRSFKSIHSDKSTRRVPRTDRISNSFSQRLQNFCFSLFHVDFDSLVRTFTEQRQNSVFFHFFFFFNLGTVVLIFCSVNIWVSAPTSGFYRQQRTTSRCQCFTRIVSIGRHFCSAPSAMFRCQKNESNMFSFCSTLWSVLTSSFESMDFVSSIVDLGILIFATIIGSLGTMISSQNQSGNDSIRDEVFFS